MGVGFLDIVARFRVQEFSVEGVRGLEFRGLRIWGLRVSFSLSPTPFLPVDTEGYTGLCADS